MTLNFDKHKHIAVVASLHLAGDSQPPLRQCQGRYTLTYYIFR